MQRAGSVTRMQASAKAADQGDNRDPGYHASLLCWIEAPLFGLTRQVSFRSVSEWSRDQRPALCPRAGTCIPEHVATLFLSQCLKRDVSCGDRADLRAVMASVRSGAIADPIFAATPQRGALTRAGQVDGRLCACRKGRTPVL